MMNTGISEVIPSSSALVFEGEDRLDCSGHAAG
jgi:hypothetical protein